MMTTPSNKRIKLTMDDDNLKEPRVYLLQLFSLVEEWKDEWVLRYNIETDIVDGTVGDSNSSIPSNKPSASLVHLMQNNDLLLNIASFLDPHDLVDFSIICKRVESSIALKDKKTGAIRLPVLKIRLQSILGYFRILEFYTVQLEQHVVNWEGFIKLFTHIAYTMQASYGQRYEVHPVHRALVAETILDNKGLNLGFDIASTIGYEPGAKDDVKLNFSMFSLQHCTHSVSLGKWSFDDSDDEDDVQAFEAQAGQRSPVIFLVIPQDSNVQTYGLGWSGKGEQLEIRACNPCYGNLSEMLYEDSTVGRGLVSFFLENGCYMDNDEPAVESEKLFLLAWLWAHRIGPFDHGKNGGGVEVDWERALASLALVDVEDPPCYMRDVMDRRKAEKNIRAIAFRGLFRVAAVSDLKV